jgi:hypothetical protein
MFVSETAVKQDSGTLYGQSLSTSKYKSSLSFYVQSFFGFNSVHGEKIYRFIHLFLSQAIEKCFRFAAVVSKL